MPPGKRKDKRTSRRCVKVYLHDKDLAEIDARRGAISRSAWCHDRILGSENFYDPLFDVSSRLAAVAMILDRERESVGRVAGAAGKLETALLYSDNLDPATRAFNVSVTAELRLAANEMYAASAARTGTNEAIIQVAREVLALVLDRQQQERARASMPWARPKA